MARRRNQGGPSLLIPMIIAGFAWIGMIGLAYYLHSEIYGNDKGAKQGLIFRLHETDQELKEYEVAVDKLGIETAKLSREVGFSGGSDIADSEVIHFKTAEQSSRKFDIFEANYTQPTNWGADDQQSYPFKVDSSYKSGNLLVKSSFPFAEFTGEENPNLKDVILAQDNFINQVLAANNSLYNAILGMIQDYNKAYRSEIQAISEEHTKTLEKINDKNEELDEQAEQDDQATEARDAQLEELIRTYNELIEIRAQIAEHEKDIDSKMKEQDRLEAQVERARERLNRIIDDAKKPFVEKNEFDGTIFYVSKRDRWAYINLGAADNIRDNMSFNIVRYLNGNHQRIGILQVKKVLSARTSQCVITNIISDELFPREGDKIQNTSYTASRKIKSFGFLGYFGGEFSKYTREEMKGHLEEAGYRVDDVIQPDTEVLILGFDYLNDPYYKFIFVSPPDATPGELVDDRHKLYEFRNTYEFMRPEEVEKILGLTK